MIVGQFNDSYPPIMDGVANVVKNYAYWLNKKDIKTYVVTSTHPEADIESESSRIIRYRSLPSGVNEAYRLGIPHFDMKFTKRLKDIPFDLVHCHCPFVSGKIAMKIANDKQIPCIATFHSKYQEDFLNVIKSEKIVKRMVDRVVEFYEKADYVWTVNEATKQTLIGYGYRGDIEVIKNGTDFKEPKDIQKRKDIIKKRYNISTDKKILLYVGQIDFKKNLEFLIHSVNRLRELNNNFLLFMVGEGSDFEEIMEMVAKYNLQNYILLTGKITDREVLKNYYAAADLFLFPSEYDTCGIVVKEAAAMKVPSIVLENTNVSSDMNNGVSGFISKKDIVIYADCINEILENEQLRIGVGENARTLLYRSWESIVTEVADRYRDIYCHYLKYRNIV